MKAARRHLLLCCLFLALLLCSCQTDLQEYTQPTTQVEQPTAADTTTEEPATEPEIGLDFSDVLAAANERHLSVVKPSDSLLEKLTEGRVPDVSKIGNFSSNTPTLREIPAADAIADTLDLFELIKDCYGGYVYFGGAEVFDPAKQAIIDELSGYESVTDTEFSEILARNLFSIVTDNHFTIGGRRGQNEAAYYYNSGDGFARDERGVFVNTVSGKRLKAVEGYDIDEIFRLHVNDVGELVWHPVVLVHSGGYSHEITLEYEDGSTQAMRLHTYTAPRSKSGASLDRASGFPVVTISQMDFDATEAGEGARQFLRYAEELADEKVVIVDLRGNPGGNGVLPQKWTHILTGEIVPQNHVILRAMPFEPIDERDEDKDSPYYVTKEDGELYYHSAEYAGYTLMAGGADAFIEREQILILLVSRNTASAAEAFADLCFNVQNTLIVGSNTGGVLNFDLTYPNSKLPRSGLDFGFGTSLFLHPEGHLIEGLGILPDIWAEGDALKAVIAMLKNAGY